MCWRAHKVSTRSGILGSLGRGGNKQRIHKQQTTVLGVHKVEHKLKNKLKNTIGVVSKFSARTETLALGELNLV